MQASRFHNRDQAKRAELFKYAFQQAVILQISLRNLYINQRALMREHDRSQAAMQQRINAKMHKEMSHWLGIVL